MHPSDTGKGSCSLVLLSTFLFVLFLSILQATGATSCAFSFALFATSAIEIATGAVPQRWVTVLIHCIVSVAFGAINALHINVDLASGMLDLMFKRSCSCGDSLLIRANTPSCPPLNSRAAVWHVLGPIVVLLTIAASSTHPPPPSWVFTHFENQTGWTNSFYVTLLGLVQVSKIKRNIIATLLTELPVLTSTYWNLLGCLHNDWI